MSFLTRHVSRHLRAVSRYDSRPIRRLLGLNERLVPPEERLRLPRSERLCAKRGEREILVRFELGSDCHGRPSASHRPITIARSFIMTCIIIAPTLLLACGSAAPAKAQAVLDLSLITCQQLLASDAERQALIGSW